MRPTVAMASRAHRHSRAVAIPFLFLAACHLSVGASTDGPSLSELESRVEAALGEAEAALDREEAQLDELAVQNSGRTLADGRPSLGQAAANIRLLDRRIRELDAGNRELREELKALLASFDSDSTEVDDVAAERARRSGTVAGFQEYLSSHPQGRHVEEIQGLLGAALGFQEVKSVCQEIENIPVEEWGEGLLVVDFDPGSYTDIYSVPVMCFLNWHTADEIDKMVQSYGHRESIIVAPTGEKFEVSSERCLEELREMGPLGEDRNLCVSFLETWKTGQRETDFSEDGLPHIRRSDYKRMSLPLRFMVGE